MFSSLENALKAIGGNSIFGLKTVAAHLVTKEGAGTPTATSTVPDHKGQYYVDTTANDLWYSKTISEPPVVGDFTKLT